MSAEKWLPVPDFVGFYEVSDHGRVKKIAPWCDGVNYHADRLLPVDRHRQGHFRVNIANRRFFVHRLVMAAFVGPAPVRHVVNHKDGNPANNRLENLEYLTVSGNTSHAFRVLHRWPAHMAGEDHRYAKLKDADIPVIVQRLGRGEPIGKIANDFRVCLATISDISRNRTWRHIKREAFPDRRMSYGKQGSNWDPEKSIPHRWPKRKLTPDAHPQPLPSSN